MEIAGIRARQALDSRGNPTIEAEVVLRDGQAARASVPSGPSSGRNEALELRDGDPERFGGAGVLRAIGNITERITPLLIEVGVREQERIEQAMCRLDGTENKSNLGANAILAVSLAVSHAAALSERMPLYAYSAQHSGNRAGFILVWPMAAAG